MPRTGTCKKAKLVIIGLSPSGGMADAADSKSAEGNLVRVRLSPRALSTLMVPSFVPRPVFPHYSKGPVHRRCPGTSAPSCYPSSSSPAEPAVTIPAPKGHATPANHHL